MSAEVRIEPLDASAGPALLAINRACPITADFVFYFDREPDFFRWPHMVFDSHEYEGIYRDGSLVGYCMAGFRRGWAGRGWGTIFYVGDARVLPSARGEGLTLRAARRLEERLPPEVSLGFFLVKQGNVPATVIAGTARPRGWDIQPLCGFEVLNIPLLFRSRSNHGCRVRPAAIDDVAAVAALAQRTSEGRLLAPYLDAETLCHSWQEAEQGTDYHFVAERSGHLCGAATFRDLGAARRTRVLRYAPRTLPLRLVHGATARLLPEVSPLPRPGEEFRALTTTLLAVQGSDPEVARALIAAAVDVGLRRRYHLLHIGFADGDPLRAAARGMIAQRFRSDLYVAVRHGAERSVASPGIPQVDLALI
jgi:hypothetical protein